MVFFFSRVSACLPSTLKNIFQSSSSSEVDDGVDLRDVRGDVAVSTHRQPTPALRVRREPESTAGPPPSDRTAIKSQLRTVFSREPPVKKQQTSH